jgi:hypothetical protein
MKTMEQGGGRILNWITFTKDQIKTIWKGYKDMKLDKELLPWQNHEEGLWKYSKYIKEFMNNVNSSSSNEDEAVDEYQAW